MQQHQHEAEKFSGSTTIDMLLMHSDAVFLDAQIIAGTYILIYKQEKN